MGRVPIGKIKVVDPSPLNWLFVLFHTMEELVGVSHEGYVIPSLATDYEWVNETTLEMTIRKGVVFHNGEELTASNIVNSLIEEQRWFSPHPPGTWINIPRGTKVEIVNDYTIRVIFSEPDALGIAKLRSIHIGNDQFWSWLGFGYAKQASGEGRW